MTILKHPFCRVDVVKGKKPKIFFKYKKFVEATLAVEKFGYKSSEANAMMTDACDYAANVLYKLMCSSLQLTKPVRYDDTHQKTGLPGEVKPEKVERREQRCFAGPSETLYNFDLPITPVPAGVNFLQYHTYMGRRQPRPINSFKNNDDKPKLEDDFNLVLASSGKYATASDESTESEPQEVPYDDPLKTPSYNSNSPESDDTPKADENDIHMNESSTADNWCTSVASGEDVPDEISQFHYQSDFKDDSSSSTESNKENDDNLKM